MNGSFSIGGRSMSRNCDPRVLITRLSHIGDCIQTVPLLGAVRRLYPKAFIAWAMERPAQVLIEGHQDLDQLIDVPRGWMKSPAAICRLCRQLRELRINIVLDPQGLTKSSVLGWLSGATTRIGFTRGAARELSPLVNNLLVTPTSPNVVDRYLELLRPLGGVDLPVQFQLPMCEDAESWAHDALRDMGLAQGFVVVNPGAGWKSRLWETDRFAAVARYLGQNHHLTSLISWAGNEEHEMAESIAAQAEGHARLLPKTSLPQLAALLRPSHLYLGTDTGPLHLAVAVGTRCISLHGSTRAERSGPHGEGHMTIQAYYQAGSSRARRSAGNDAMRAITVHQVCRACDQVLQPKSGGDEEVHAA